MANDIPRSLRFYGELVLVTTVVLVAAQMWVRFLCAWAKHAFGKAYPAVGALALLLSALAVALPGVLFAERRDAHKPRSMTDFVPERQPPLSRDVR